jgi:hypothetical protein
MFVSEHINLKKKSCENVYTQCPLKVTLPQNKFSNWRRSAKFSILYILVLRNCFNLVIVSFLRIWLSPLFPRLPAESSTVGDSVTYFKRDLLEYVSAYKAPLLGDWIKVIRQHDMTAAKYVIKEALYLYLPYVCVYKFLHSTHTCSLLFWTI